MSLDNTAKEQIQEEVKLGMELEQEVSEAIRQVLDKWGITGKYIFNVRKDADYCQEPVEYLKGKKLKWPKYSLASGCAKVEEPNYIQPV